MVALWIRAGTRSPATGALGIRLLGPLSAALGSLLLADAAERLLPGRRAGLIAAALLNATLLFGVGAVIMTPDTPLLFFWIGCLWALARFLRERERRAGWSRPGLFAGLALASKYTAVLLAGGDLCCGCWSPRTLRRWLLRPAPWFGALAGHRGVRAGDRLERGAWLGQLRQAGRPGGRFAPGQRDPLPGRAGGGQIGPGHAARVRALRRRRSSLPRGAAGDGATPPGRCSPLLTFLPAFVFVQHALGDRVQGNWPAVLYPAAAHRRGRAASAASGSACACPPWRSASPSRAGLCAGRRRSRSRCPPGSTRSRCASPAGAASPRRSMRRAARTAPASSPPTITVCRRAGLRSLPGRPGDRRRAPLVPVRPAAARRSPGSRHPGSQRPPWPRIDMRAWASARPIGEIERRSGALVMERFRLYRVVGRARPGVAQAILPSPG